VVEGQDTAREDWTSTVARTLAAVLTVLSAAWSIGVPRYLGVAYYPEQFLSLILGLALALAYLTLPARRGAERGVPPWYDLLAAAVGLTAGCIMAVRYPDLVDMILLRPPEAVAVGAVVVLLILEALRRATGWALFIIVSVFLLYALFGDIVPGRLSGRPQDWQKLAAYLAFDVNGILGVPMAIVSTVVVAFVFFGHLLTITGGSRFFTDAALILMGRFRGGSMKIAVLGSALFGSISGSAVANVVATGVVTIPMIKKSGYPAHKAAAIESVASTGGQLLPPVMGAAAFLMAEFLHMPYSGVVTAAIVPGLLYYAALFIQADLEAARLGISAVDEREIPQARSVLGGLHFALAFAALILALFSLNWQPERAALFAAAVVIVTGLLFGYQGVRPTPKQILEAVSRTGRSVIDIILISAAAGVIIGVLNITGLSFNLTYALVQVGGGSMIPLLLLAAVVCIVLGMGLPTLGVYVLLAALVAPALVEVGVNPIAAHLYVLYFGMMSMITPPVAIAAFAAAGLAQASPMRTGYEAVRFGWAAYIVPFLFAASPSLLLIGAPAEIALACVTALMGVWLISAALAGYFMLPLSAVTRILFVAAGLAALVPAGAFPAAVYTDIAGVGAGLALMGREVWRQRQLAPKREPAQ
jgi:TRAP transporter 4TM/12TM fusion protein